MGGDTALVLGDHFARVAATVRVATLRLLVRARTLLAVDDHREAGALAGWLSGSGAAIMCLTEQKEKAVAEAMANVFAKQQIRCETHILIADNDGTRVKRA